ncbi:NUDIX hydrolase [Marinomonas spartinae]|uniref:NUDIX hydrolase n=1 Tax=Marinomonas spartinae TaxID=1792290 RepID=UPI0018F1CD79|nr:NUDIX domain-containing protein [Marinomonas spartinae]MBJ7556141.1 NUDIX domain-containing protein [Marinomonas spartinae]
MSATDEIITLVDKNNTVIGEVARRLMKFGEDYHRVTYILVFNTKGNLLIQKRTDNKAFCPGFYGVATGGVVETGESYIESAHRELKEEMGFDADLTSHGIFYTEGTGFKIWGKIYSCCYDESIHGPLVLQAKEVASVHEMSVDEVLNNHKQLPFTPDSLDALYHYANQLTAPSSSDPE